MLLTLLPVSFVFFLLSLLFVVFWPPSHCCYEEVWTSLFMDNYLNLFLVFISMFMLNLVSYMFGDHGQMRWYLYVPWFKGIDVKINVFFSRHLSCVIDVGTNGYWAVQKWGHGSADSQCIRLNNFISRLKPCNAVWSWPGSSCKIPFFSISLLFPSFIMFCRLVITWVDVLGLRHFDFFPPFQDSMKYQTRFVSQKPAKVVLSSMEVVAQSMGFKTHIRNYKVNLPSCCSFIPSQLQCFFSYLLCLLVSYYSGLSLCLSLNFVFPVPIYFCVS